MTRIELSSLAQTGLSTLACHGALWPAMEPAMEHFDKAGNHKLTKNKSDNVLSVTALMLLTVFFIIVLTL